MIFNGDDGESLFKAEHINLNTVIAVVGFLGMFATFIGAWTTIRYKQDEMEKWQVTSSTQYSTIVARIDALQTALNKQDEVTYRVAQTEKYQENMDTRINRIAESSSSQFNELRAQLGLLATQITIAN